MAWKIDLERVREAYKEFGQETPFYEFQTDVPRPNLNELVRRGFLIRAGNKNKGYLWTASVESLLAEAEERDNRAAALREMAVDIGEHRRGFSFGTRRIPRLPDSDGNPTDPNNIDQS
ncbi:MAG: hypothetical protein ACOY3M_01890 [Patescibacteria group bacterium]